jgi:AraC-like DNA-binding protein
MYNSRGIESACKTAVPRNGKELFLVMLRVCLFDDSAPGTDNDTRISAIIDASKAVIRFCGNHDISARISPNTFLCLVQSKADASLLADCLGSILLQHKKYMDVFGADSFACSAVQFDADNYDGCVEQLTEDIERQTRLSEERRLINHYREMSEMRNYVYQNPNKTYDTNALHERFSGSTGYFRSIYKQCFGASFHKDCISARIARAKYQLSTTTLSVMDISEKCGYLDSKYFLRQFSSCSGMTPIQYRNLLKS